MADGAFLDEAALTMAEELFDELAARAHESSLFQATMTPDQIAMISQQPSTMEACFEKNAPLYAAIYDSTRIQHICRSADTIIPVVDGLLARRDLRADDLAQLTDYAELLTLWRRIAYLCKDWWERYGAGVHDVELGASQQLFALTVHPVVMREFADRLVAGSAAYHRARGQRRPDRLEVVDGEESALLAKLAGEVDTLQQVVTLMAEELVLVEQAARAHGNMVAASTAELRARRKALGY